jgi:hypothetical protein
MDYDLETLVTAVTNQAYALDKAVRRMRGWYVFSDKRPGTVQERFDLDARQYREYQDLFKGY